MSNLKANTQSWIKAKICSWPLFNASLTYHALTTAQVLSMPSLVVSE